MPHWKQNNFSPRNWPHKGHSYPMGAEESGSAAEQSDLLLLEHREACLCRNRGSHVPAAWFSVTHPVTRLHRVSL